MQRAVDVVKLQKQDSQMKIYRSCFEPSIYPRTLCATYGDHGNTELTEDEFVELQEFSKEQGITFTASGQDKPSSTFCTRLECHFSKLGQEL